MVEKMLEYLLCPECHRRISLNDEEKANLEERQGTKTEKECGEGHVFSLHNGLMAARLQPNYYDVLWKIQGVESGSLRMRVGEWQVVRLVKPFVKIDKIAAICFPMHESSTLPGVRVEANFDNTNPIEFWVVAGGDEGEWGETVRIDWTVYGIVPTTMEIWRENLIFAARHFLSASYRPSVIQSAVAVESYAYDLVISHLKNCAKWNPGTVNDFIDASKSRDALPLRGMLKVCVEEVMGIRIQNWPQLNRLRKMRNSLAHGDLTRYKNFSDLAGRRFAGERERTEFAYTTAVRFIYDVRYADMDGE